MPDARDLSSSRIKPLRVLITGEVLAHRFTGVGFYISELVKALARREDLRVSILCREDAHAAPFKPRVAHIIHRPPECLGPPVYWLRSPPPLAGFDVIHCPTARAPFWNCPAGPKLVMTIHDLAPVASPESHPLAYRVYFRRLLPHWLGQCDALIADSLSTSHDLQRFYRTPEECIHVVPLGRRWDIPQDTAIVEKQDHLLAVGTLEPRKNLLRVLEAFHQVKQRRPELPDRLLVAGCVGWKGGPVERALRQSPDVQMLGYVDDQRLEQLYRRAKGLVYPSLYEGFGLPVLEAMTLGCPVITSDRTSLPEVGGRAALYVDPESIAEITAAMERLLTDPQLRRERMAAGCQRAAEFSWDRCAEETMQVYRHVLKEQP